MIVSHKHRFIFIKTKKVAGTALGIALSRFLGPDDIVTPLARRNEFYNHMPAGQVRARLGNDVWNTYFKFSIERNPWDKAYSRYCWNVRNRDMTFRDYVLREGAYRGSDYDLYCIDGIPGMDVMIRYEALEEGLSRVSARIGLTEDVFALMNATKANSQYRTIRDYREVYDDETRRVIATQYAREIALFGYEF